MKRKILWVIIILILAVAFAGGYFYFQKWWGAKEQKIQMGLASDKFPWRNYTEEELAKMYPQIKYADVPTRVSPEETYAKFREALKTNNLELAIEQLGRESVKYQENSNNLSDFYRRNKFNELYGFYPEQIRKSYLYESIAQYEYDSLDNGKIFVNSINFVKNVEGDWKLDSL